LRWPDVDRTALCERAGMSGDRADSALAELRTRGLVEPARAGLGLVPADPGVSLEHAVAIEQRELAARLAKLADLRAQLPALALEYAQGRQRIAGELPIEVVHGLETTRKRVLMLARAARTETLSIDDPLTSAFAAAISLDTDLNVLDRGVVGRTLIQRDSLDDEATFRYLGAVAAAGEQVRLADRVPTRMLVFDAEVAVVPLDAADRNRGCMVVRVRTIIDLCVFLFEQLWAAGSPLFVIAADGAPTGRAARVLELMAAGRKDESIARFLGVGVRTVRRDIAGLMSEVGEHTRASTVAAAIRRGWLSA
jgi:DNA-binding CsgD family transcriptional regulator